MPITRGHSFDVNEFVTADSLHKLVDSANITDLTPDEFTGEIHGLVTATPASIRDGDLFFLHETSVSLTRPTGLALWTNPNYLVHYNGQWVSLFGGDHLETGRFFNEIGGTIGVGEHGHFAALAGAGTVTLSLAVNANTAAKAASLGGNQISSADGTVTRLRIIGYGLFKGSSKTSPNSPWFDTVYHGSATSEWVRSTVTLNNGYNAMRLNSTADGDSDTGRVQPCYHLGSLNFRA